MEQGKIRIVNRVNLFPSRDWLDEHIMEAIFIEQYPRVFSLLYRLVGDQDEADDLTAETFWRLWKNPPGKNENLAGWLYRVSTRLGYNSLRSKHRRGEYEAQFSRAQFEASGKNEPEGETDKRLELERVRATLRQLPLRQVQILVLRHSGLSYKEISSALNISTNIIGSLLSRAEEAFERLYRRGDQNAPE